MDNLITPDFDAIPEFLRQEKYWCVWPAEPKQNGGISKRPLGAGGYPIGVDNPEKWISFDNAKAFYKANKGKTLHSLKGPIAGIGVLFHDTSFLVGIDIDHVINPDGKIEQWAQPFINELTAITYCELSPSGTGIHAYLCGEKPSEKCKGGPDNNLEVYEAGRYFTVTGRKLDGCQNTVIGGAEAQAMIDKLVAYIRGSKKTISTEKKKATRKPLQKELKQLAPKDGPETLTDSELIAKARQAKDGRQFSALFDGDISAYPSASEADLALANKLAFWTGKDAGRMDSLMRQSALLQEPERLAKWDKVHSQGATYGEATIAKAIRDCPKCFGDTNSTRGGARSYKAIPDRGKPKIAYVVGQIPRIITEFDKAIHDKAWRNDKFVVDVVKLPEAKSYKGVRIPKESKVICRHTVESLSLLASKCVTWVKYKEKDNTTIEVEIDPPVNIMRLYLAAKNDWTLPILTGIASCPLLRPDGSLLNKPGYDADTGLYCDFNPKNFPTVKSNPDKNDAVSALGLIEAALSEFPFKTDVDKAVTLAAMLTTVLRPSVDHAPLFAFSAPCPGTGKSTLADMIGIMTTGKPCAAMDFNRDEAEFKKSLFATLLEGSPIILIDNVVGDLNNSKLDQAISQEETKGRVLGISENSNVSFCPIWLATGNNLTICGDLGRRTLICTLDANEERPAEREFRRNIYKWTNDHRGELVQAALTILRAYHLAGRPIPNGTKPMNNFNDWSHWVRGALLWLGIADPKDSQIEIEAHDPEREGLRSVLQAWHDHFGSDFVTTKDLLNRKPPKGESAIPDSQEALYQALMDAIPHRGELTGKKLGNWLAKYDGRVIDGLKLIDTGQKCQNSVYWKVTEKLSHW